MIKTQPIRLTELAKIRSLEDLDLAILIRTISAQGWPFARKHVLRQSEKQAELLRQHKEAVRPMLQWIHKQTGRTLQNDLGTRDEIAKIRKLDNFDLRQLISEIHDRGWEVARILLLLMPPDADSDAWDKAMGRARAEGRIGPEWEKQRSPAVPSET